MPAMLNNVVVSVSSAYFAISSVINNFDKKIKFMFKLPEKRILLLQESFCISIAICFGIAIKILLKNELANWIPMTTCIMFLAANQGQGAILKRTFERISGIIFGTFFGFLYIDLLMYGNYHWGYMLPILWFLGFYTFYITNNYTILSAMIMMFFAILMSIDTVYPISTLDIMLQCVLFTIVGTIIAFGAELLIYKNAASKKESLKNEIKSYFYYQGEIIRLASNFFLDEKKTTPALIEEFRKSFWMMISNQSSIENMYFNIRYEFDHNEKSEKFYQAILNHSARMDKATRKLAGVIAHDKYKDGSDLETLKKLSEKISDEFKNISFSIMKKKPDNTSSELLNLIKKTDRCEKMNPVYLYIKAIYEFSIIVDEILSY